ncbi:hypothetical protein KIV45_15570 [Janthinobacterium lividum]|nr:hypothetical protein KIV45_15570 [Janthinobacterium lividum]
MIDNDSIDSLEQAANLAIKLTAAPRDYLGPATDAMKTRAALGEKIAAAIRTLHVTGPSVTATSQHLAVPDGWTLVPLEPTPAIIAGAAIASWPTATLADIDLARDAAPLVLMQMNMAPGTTVDALAGMLATMAPAYRAMLAAAPAAPVQEQPATASTDSFQFRVQPWMMACFGAEISADGAERNHRFLEESLELVQACGCTASEAHQLVDYVYGRPVSERAQEVGGVMVTLAALCLAQDLDMHAAGETELARIWTKVEAIRAKQAAKPKHSPLPAITPPVGSEVETIEQARANFEDWYTTHAADIKAAPIGSRDSMLQWSSWIAARSGNYLARWGWGVSSMPWGTAGAPTAAGLDASAEMRALCSACGGTGDVHRADGEWLGECTCIHAKRQRQELQAHGEHPAPCARICEAPAFHNLVRERDARIAQLEAQLVRRCAPLSPEAQQAIAAARAAGQTIAATPGAWSS